ncbi:MAG TPA: alpha/beta hydrolase [Acidimicrobiales bacterium]|nr:alpha/beta hydrolase [Acidimicrobiales bacterium]
MSPSPVQASLAVVELAREGRFEEIRGRFVADLQPLVPPESLRAAWEAEIAGNGAFIAAGAPVSDPPAHGVTVVRVPLHFERGERALLVSATDDGDLVGLQLAAAGAAEPLQPWEPPSYADPESFEESDVVVGPHGWTVPGTLALPRRRERAAKAPAVVLLAGSGPQDRDVTIGRNKPLKDLAWGLASRDIAVLRFDKVTFALRDELAGVASFTLADEYLPQALGAIELLSRHPAVDGERIFVLGHSLGGTVAPRVAAAAPSVAGLVVMAGGSVPMHWAAVHQLRYLASLDPSGGAMTAVEEMAARARAVDDPALSATTPASSLPFGVPAEYWLDVRAYDPVATAAGLRLPMLILQGGRDYQVTVEEDLARWESGLADRPDVTFRLFPADDHLFFAGDGPSTPAGYEAAQHVDAEVVAEVAAWLGGANGSQRRPRR